MGVANYNPIVFSEGQCVDPVDDLQPILDNLKALFQFARQTGQRISCQKIDTKITEEVDDGEGECFVIRERSLPEPGEQLEKKIPMLVITSNSPGYLISGDNDDSEVVASTTVSFLCNDEKVWEGTLAETAFAGFDCFPSSKLEICIQTDLSVRSATVIRQQRTHTVCGGIMCIERFDVENSIPTFFCPPCVLKPESKPGREFLNLVYQNTLGLCRYFQTGGQTQACQGFLFEDSATHPLITSVSGETTYFIIGEVRVCVRVNLTDFKTTRSITVNPSVGCEGEPNQCSNGETVTVSSDNESEFPIFDCVSVPVVICGTCLPGQTLSVGFIQNEECDGVPTPFGNGAGDVDIYLVEQEYCLYAWEQVPIPELGGFSRPNASCFNVNTLNDLMDKQNLLESIVCDRQPLDCSFNEGEKIVPRFDTHLLAAAETPPVPLPPNWPPNRKVSLIIDFRFCIDFLNGGLDSGEFTALGRVEVVCGGNVIKTLGREDGQDYQFKIDTAFTFRGCSPTYSRFCCNIECPVDQDLILRPVITAFGIHNTNFNWDTVINCTQISF